MNYQVITDVDKLDEFIAFLPELEDSEVYYVNLFARNKYVKELGNKKEGQLVRFVSKKDQIKEKLRRLECPVGSYSRDGVVMPQEALSIYIGLNPRSLVRANKELLITLARRLADGDFEFNPISQATTEIHRSTSRKFFLDFDFDGVAPEEHLAVFQETLPVEAYKILKTRGGFHLIVETAKVKSAKPNWYRTISALPNCDVRGADMLTPVAGTYQGGFTPHFV